MKKNILFLLFIFSNCALFAQMYQFSAAMQSNRKIGYDEYAYFSENIGELERTNTKFKFVADASPGLIIVGDIGIAKEIPADIYQYNPKKM